MGDKQYTEKFIEIERSFDVNCVKVGSIHLWPFLRLKLYQELSVGFDEAVPPMKAESKFEVFLRNAKSVARFPFQILELGKNGKTDVLYFSRPEDHSDFIQSCYYDRFVDPLVELCRGKFKTTKLELESKLGNARHPRFERTVIVSDKVFSYLSRIGEKLRVRPVIENFEPFAETVKRVTGVRLDEAQIIGEWLEVVRARDFFKPILKLLRPNVVLMVCYYRPKALGLILAAKELQIQTVDIQHGKRGKFHSMSSWWTCVPKEGYGLLPDKFWVWGEESKNQIENAYPKGTKHHLALVGGNLWLEKWKSGTIPFHPADEQTDFVRKLGTFKAVILVSLQPWTDPLPAHLLKAMKEGPKDWMWLIRMHPRQMAQVSNLEELVKNSCAGEFDIRNASRLPLYFLLQFVHHHMTRSSSVSFDALAFHIRTSILDSGGLGDDEDFVKKGDFDYCPESESILNSVNRAISERTKSIMTRYAIADRQVALSAVRTFFTF